MIKKCLNNKKKKIGATLLPEKVFTEQNAWQVMSEWRLFWYEVLVDIGIKFYLGIYL